jgi:hypothetical protein
MLPCARGDPSSISTGGTLGTLRSLVLGGMGRRQKVQCMLSHPYSLAAALKRECGPCLGPTAAKAVANNFFYIF